LVTGASSGIGESAARQLAKRGFTVYAAARRVERMKELEAEGIRILKMDVTDDASMSEGIDKIIADTGRIDALVNNAGYGSYGAIEDVPMSEAKYQFEVNVFGLARLTQLVLPHMRAQGSGRIINISSVGGRIWEPMGGWYHATKFAVEGLSDSLRVEVKPFGIQVVVIQPGAIRTEWGDIAAENVLKTSADGAYADQARRHAAVLALDSDPRFSSGPEVIGKVIARAATARRPRTRYAVGSGAKPVVYGQRLLTDRGFDRTIVTAYNLAAKLAARRTPPD
jgi:NAD(P)-dependent dehydrogenase (short-subunit alcohol dehydrogenase family)